MSTSEEKPDCRVCGEPWSRHDQTGGQCPDCLGIYMEGPPPTFADLVVDFVGELVEAARRRRRTERRGARK